MIYADDRTDEQVETHTTIILMTDRFMSGWGKANGGPSYAGWACESQHRNAVLSWVESRSDAMRVREVSNGYRPPSGPGHCHIYVVTSGHPSIGGAS